MKLIWYSVAPWATTGYGIVTRALVPRIKAAGHEVIIATKHFHTGRVMWEGCEVINGVDVELLDRMIKNEGVDYIISLLDIHTLMVIPHRWIAYSPVDTQFISESIKSRLDSLDMLISLSEHGKKAYKDVGYDSEYAPHGVDTKIYFPHEEARVQARKNFEWRSNFIVGMVGVNYDDDRKNYVNSLMAFKELHDKHEDVRMFISANLVDSANAFPLPMIVDNLGLTGLVKFGNTDEYFKGRVTDEMMANRYRAFDVFLMPTRGEGFGIPLIEAQACGTPVITTGASTGPELLGGGWLIPVGKYDWQFFNKTWRPMVGGKAVYDKLEESYDCWKEGTLKSKGEEAAKFVHANYDWDYVFDKYWVPILNKIENMYLDVTSIPDYRKVYKELSGRAMMHDCESWCDVECHGDQQDLPGESTTGRNVLNLCYPMIPSEEEGKFLVDTFCPLHKWISRRFIREVETAWEYLWGFPEIRKSIKNIDRSSYIPIEDVKIDFDDSYRWAMQSQYYTVCPDLSPIIPYGSKVLDIGCGDGERVLKLRSNGIDAVGCEINKSWVNDDYIHFGSAEDLPYEDNSFDFVMSVDVLEHVDNPYKALSEMFRVSKNLVVAFLTPVEATEFYEDPTHKVEWNINRWKREFNEFGELVDMIQPIGFVVKKRSG